MTEVEEQDTCDLGYMEDVLVGQGNRFNVLSATCVCSQIAFSHPAVRMTRFFSYPDPNFLYVGPKRPGNRRDHCRRNSYVLKTDNKKRGSTCQSV